MGEDLITDGAFDDVTDNNNKTDKEKGVALARAVESTINEDPQKLVTLIEVLKKVDAFQCLTEELDKVLSN